MVQPTPEIASILQRPTMRKALAAANRTLLDRGEPIEHGFPVLEDEEAGAPLEQRVPTARAFQLAKEHIDSLLNDAVRNGRGGEVGVVELCFRRLTVCLVLPAAGRAAREMMICELTSKRRG